MIAALVVSCVARCSIPPVSYFTYHISEYYLNPGAYILCLASFAYMFLIFSYGILEICNIKRLAGIFLIIQPAILIIDLVSDAVYEMRGISVINQVFKMLITLWLIRLADLYLFDRGNFSRNFSNNKKPMLISLLIAVLLAFAVEAAGFAVDFISLIVLNSTSNYYVVVILVFINFAIQLAILLTGMFVIGKQLNRVSVYPTDMLSGGKVYPQYQLDHDSKKTAILISVVVVVLIIATTAYFLREYGNQLGVYLDFIYG